VLFSCVVSSLSSLRRCHVAFFLRVLQDGSKTMIKYLGQFKSPSEIQQAIERGEAMLDRSTREEYLRNKRKVVRNSGNNIS
jgi:hypothetical protein